MKYAATITVMLGLFATALVAVTTRQGLAPDAVHEVASDRQVVSSPSAASHVAAETTEDWEEKLRRLLRGLCAILNGAPCDLSESQPVSTWIAQIDAMYQADGCPPPSTELDDLLSELELHLQDPDNDLSTGDNAILNTIIASCSS